MKKIESAAVMAAKATVKAAGFKLSSTEGKNMLADLMAASHVPTFGWDSISSDGLYDRLRECLALGIDPIHCSDWSSKAFNDCYRRQSLTSEQKIRKQFPLLFDND
jgi:hypothetical protein